MSILCSVGDAQFLSLPYSNDGVYNQAINLDSVDGVYCSITTKNITERINGGESEEGDPYRIISIITKQRGRIELVCKGEPYDPYIYSYSGGRKETPRHVLDEDQFQELLTRFQLVDSKESIYQKGSEVAKNTPLNEDYPPNPYVQGTPEYFAYAQGMSDYEPQ